MRPWPKLKQERRGAAVAFLNGDTELRRTQRWQGPTICAV